MSTINTSTTTINTRPRALVIAEHDNTQLNIATQHAVGAAMQCGVYSNAVGIDVDVWIAGFQCGAVAQSTQKLIGVTQVWHADASALVHHTAEIVAAQIVQHIKKYNEPNNHSPYTHVVLCATASGKSLAPRIAAMLDVAQVSEVTHIHPAQTPAGAVVFDRPIYAGNAIATVQSTDFLRVLTVRATNFAATPMHPHAETAHVNVNMVDCAWLETDATLAKASRFVSQKIAVNERPELTVAKVVVSGGRALGSAEQFAAVITPLADALGAAIGASRAAVDAGYAPNDWQVGQTGKIVAPELYVACGISGAIQHIAGMKDSKVIVAINKDPEAPIFGIADYCLEADLFVAVPEWVAAIQK